MKLVIKVRQYGPGGYQAWCPSLPGCFVWGQTKDQTLHRMQEAVAGYLASMEVALPRELRRAFETELAGAA